MYHLVWIPKYRKRLLEGKLAKRVEELIRECAELNDWEVHEISVQPNHVHIMVQLNPNISVSKAVQYFKGGSSRVLRKEFVALKEFLWGDSFWADGYFAETSGQLNEVALRKYIQNQ
jgi:putative transposase